MEFVGVRLVHKKGDQYAGTYKASGEAKEDDKRVDPFAPEVADNEGEVMKKHGAWFDDGQRALRFC